MSTRTRIVIRLSDKEYGLSNTVTRHNSIAFKHGAVWIGKPDHPSLNRE
ncbi:MAG TPA: hypothetical protein VK249_12315 [Anaerolineales bacterium]|nr:hypothetical protein [Anaerolineales bacterium]